MRTIDRATWARRSHFELFSRMAYPYVGLTAPVDVSPIHAAAQRAKVGLFKPILWAVSHAANAVPELRQRIRGETIVEHDVVHPSYTALATEAVFNYCTVDHDDDIEAFFAAVDRETAAVADNTELVPDAPHRDDLLFVSSIPWRKITSFGHPVPLDPPDSFPRLSWSRVEALGDGRAEVMMQVTANHALVDGVHIARFFDAVEAASHRVAAALPSR